MKANETCCQTNLVSGNNIKRRKKETRVDISTKSIYHRKAFVRELLEILIVIRDSEIHKGFFKELYRQLKKKHT